MQQIPANILEPLSALTNLEITQNQLTTLAEDIFIGLKSLEELQLKENVVDPLLLHVSLEKIGSGACKAVIPGGAPFDIHLPITVKNGSIAGKKTEIIVPKGSVESYPITITRIPCSLDGVTVEIGKLPSIPAQHNGYMLFKTDHSSISMFGTSNKPPIFAIGSSITRSIPENSPSGVNIGDPITATDANGDTLVYNLSGTDADTFTIASSTGQLMTNAPLDYESQSTYSLTVTASDSEGETDTINLTVNVIDINEVIANRAPVFSDGDSTTRSILENTPAGVNILPAISATDADSDTLFYTLSGTDAATFGIDNTTGHLKTSAPLDFETKSNYSVEVSVSDGSTTDAITVNINIEDKNEAPLFTEGNDTSRVVFNHAEVGTNVGDAVTASDEDKDPLTFSMSETGTEPFKIDSETGQIILNDVLGTQETYTLNLTVSDGELIDTINVIVRVSGVRVSDINNLPTFSEGDSTSRSIAENLPNGTNIGSAISALDDDEIDTLTYSLTGTDATSFDINRSNGQLMTGSVFDFEDKSIYEVTVSVSDGNGGSDSIKVTITIIDTNDVPMFSDGTNTSRSITENESADSNIGSPITARDQDRDNLVYSLDGTDAASFSIDSTDGQLKTNDVLNYENKSTYEVTVHVSDGNTGSDSIDVTINIIDANDTPIFSERPNTARSIPENATNGTNIGDPVTATDEDGDDLIYSLGGSDAATFDIESTDGQLKTSSDLAFNTKSSYEVTVSVSDGNGGTDTINVTINIRDTNDVPEFTDGPSTERSIPENVSAGANIGDPVAARDQDGDNLQYSLDGTDAAKFSIDSTNGQLKTNAALDFEDKSSYAVIVSVSDGNGGTDTINVTIKVVDANDAPKFSERPNTARSIPENATNGSNIGDPVTATDEDGDDLIYSLGGSDAATFDIESTDGQLKTSSDLAFNTKSSYEVTVSVSDGNGGTDTINVTINIRDTNDPPEFTDGPSTERSIAENVGAGANIGDPVAARDQDGDNLQYSLDGTDAAKFSIDSTNGQLKTNAALDFEDTSSYAVTVTVSDRNGGNDTINVTIKVIDANDAPVFSDGPSTTRFTPENVSAGTNIGDPVAAKDQDGDELTYSLGGTDAATFDIDSTDGQLKTSAALTFEGKSSYAVTISVSDGNGGTDTINVTIDIRDANDAPEFDDGTSTERSITENVGTGANIGDPVAARDQDGDNLRYSLGGTDAASFSIDSTDGQLKTNATLDFEDTSSYAVIVSVSDGNGGTDTINVTIKVIDANDAPEFTDGPSTTRSVTENVSASTHIGDPVNATDQDGDEPTYSLGGTDAATFDIDSTNGQLKTSAPLDFEGTSSYEVTVSVSDGNGGTDTINVTIDIRDANDAPEFTDGPSTERSTPENVSAGTNIGDPVEARDQDEDNLQYSLGGTDAASFSIDSTNGQLKTNAALDFEDTSSYEVTVSVSDGNGGTDTINVTIKVVDANDAPEFTDGPSTTRSIPENVGAGTNIEDPVEARDQDDDELTYSLGGTDAASFDIDTTNGQLKTKSALDYEDTQSYTVTVTANDSKGGTDSIQVTINVSDLDETPSNNPPDFSDGDSTTRSIPENTPANQDIGSPVEAEDLDNNTLVYSLSGTDASSFGIESGTGQLKTSAPLDYEDKDEYTVSITANDGTLTDSITVNIKVVDVNDAPVFNDDVDTGPSVDENIVSGENIGTPLSATDDDKDTLEYALSGTDQAVFSIDSTSGQLKTKDPLDFEDKSTYSVIVSVSDNEGGSDTISVTINVNDVNDPPTFSDGDSTDRSVPENTGNGVNIGSAVEATDEDQDTRQYTLGGTDAASFGIDSTNGQLKTSASLNFEDKSTYSVIVSVSDNNGGSDTISVTINVDDVNDPPTFKDDNSTDRSVPENTGSGADIGSAITATDEDDDTLEYTLGGTDQAVFSIDSTSGQLKTKDPLDYEDKSTYSVIVSVSDNNGGSDTISVTINVDGVNDPPTFNRVI